MNPTKSANLTPCQGVRFFSAFLFDTFGESANILPNQARVFFANQRATDSHTRFLNPESVAESSCFQAFTARLRSISTAGNFWRRANRVIRRLSDSQAASFADWLIRTSDLSKLLLIRRHRQTVTAPVRQHLPPVA